MPTSRTYLDYNATAPVPDAVREAVVGALALAGNPSSVHVEGRAARAVIEVARERIATLTGAVGEDVTFTSGGTEANALAIQNVVTSGLAGRLVVSATEHPSVIEAARHSGAALEVLPVDGNGIVDLDALTRCLRSDPAPALVCVMHANNETGAVQPINEVAAVTRAHGSLLHVDAIQSMGRLPVSTGAPGVDSLALSGHKIGGPKGVGALVTRQGLTVSPMLHGGGQERGRRSGTENLPGIAGFAAAAEIALSHQSDMIRIGALRDRLEAAVSELTPDVVVFSRGVCRLANTSCFAVPGARAETLVIALDLAGVAVSSGSACSSGKVGDSHVLAAMGFDRTVADGAVRVSLGWQSTEEDIERFVAAWRDVASRRRTRNEIAA